MGSQAAFLARVKRALRKEASTTGVREPSIRDDPVLVEEVRALRARLQNQRPALVPQLQQQLTAVGGVVGCVTTIAEATAYISRLAQEKNARLVVRWPSEILRALEVDAALQAFGIGVRVAAPAGELSGESLAATAFDETRQAMRELLAEADIGLSAVDYAIAETGTLALSALPGQMRGVSLLPPVHVAVVSSEQIVANMADYLLLMRATGPDVQERLTSCVSFITGPSRTGDIELTLTVGVHGPGELHLIILDEF